MVERCRNRRRASRRKRRHRVLVEARHRAQEADFARIATRWGFELEPLDRERTPSIESDGTMVEADPDSVESESSCIIA